VLRRPPARLNDLQAQASLSRRDPSRIRNVSEKTIKLRRPPSRRIRSLLASRLSPRIRRRILRHRIPNLGAHDRLNHRPHRPQRHSRIRQQPANRGRIARLSISAEI
jgi:hypothetical protein